MTSKTTKKANEVKTFDFVHFGVWCMYLFLMLLVLLSSTGCSNKLKEQFLGKPKENTVYQEKIVNVWYEHGPIQSDHDVVASGQFNNPNLSFIVELCTNDSTCLPLPFYAKDHDITVTYLRQGALISIYNAHTKLSQFPYYKITAIEGLEQKPAINP